MKYILLICMFFAMQSCSVRQKTIVDFENNEKGTLTSINVPLFLIKPYIKKVLREESDSEDLVKLVRKVKKIKIFILENTDDTQSKLFEKNQFGNQLQELASINSHGSRIQISSNANTTNENEIKDLFISIKEGGSTIFVNVFGVFSLEDISKMVNSVEHSDWKNM